MFIYTVIHAFQLSSHEITRFNFVRSYIIGVASTLSNMLILFQLLQLLKMSEHEAGYSEMFI